jgi:hypothetical protein
MTDLVEKIRDAISDDRFLVSRHASRRLRERGATAWQVIDATLMGRAHRIQVDAEPNPKVLFQLLLADGSEWTAVWSWLGHNKTAKLVPVYLTEQ